eukprot:CAMPEP_0170854624 /NCGR_PEP_ID=MMETSP0734-20130129/13337_1 /TAXON_ID=186038 /ORGANISM="Fragilariopsis kerguelensis, Strain L26-C5" /LENGTH=48 /DNA_ID= /DNA_START= /DNA_END= /DNA_ORIENTATION=
MVGCRENALDPLLEKSNKLDPVLEPQQVAPAARWMTGQTGSDTIPLAK